MGHAGHGPHAAGCRLLVLGKADGLEDVGGHGLSLGPLALQAVQPAGRQHNTEQDLRGRPGIRGSQPLRESVGGQGQAGVGAFGLTLPACGGADMTRQPVPEMAAFALAVGGEDQHLVGAELEHAAYEHLGEARVVVGIGQDAGQG